MEENASEQLAGSLGQDVVGLQKGMGRHSGQRPEESSEKWESCIADGTNMADREQGGMMLILCPFLL